MSEHLKAEDLNLTFKIGSVILHLAGGDLELTTENACVFTFRQAAMLNNFVWNDETGSHRMYLDPSIQEEVFANLSEAGINHADCSAPSDAMVADWWRVEMDDFDEDLRLYRETGELYGID